MRGDSVIDVVGLLGGRPVGDAAFAAVRNAALVAGGREQLEHVADLVGAGAELVVVGAGLGALDAVAAHPGPVCVLASGDPGFHGIVRALAARVGAERLAVHPAPSSVALAFARLALPWDGAAVASAHTGGALRAAAEVAAAERAAVLCGPDAPPEAIGAALVTLGAHPTLVAVATRLGEPGERVERLAGVDALAAGSFDHRSVVVLVHDVPPPRPTAGRPVADFVHRAGMITKPEVRAVALGRLDLPASGVLWDVGSGSGSVAVEAALAAPGLRVVAVDHDPRAVEAIVANASLHGALVEVVEGRAPEVLAGLPTPDRAFVGGGGLDVLDACCAAVRPGGRVVATFAAADRALAARARGGELVQVGVDRAVDLPGGGVRFQADNPVFVWWTDVTGHDPATERVAVGIGCSTSATAAEVDAAVADALAGRAPDVVATVDRRLDHPALAGRGAIGFGPLLLGAVDVPNPSAAVEEAVGTPSVAEAAALLAAGPGARLVVDKHRTATATAAVAVAPARSTTTGGITVVGLGPGAAAHRTPAATAAVRRADAVLGYGPYVDAAAPLLRPDQLVVRAGMGEEEARARAAVELAAAGWKVAVVSSGDPGVFAMAATVLAAAPPDVEVTVVPGVTAAHAAGAAARAPLGGPHACLTLSDLLLPAATIDAQLRAAATAGLALALYNPRSAGRPDGLARARTVLREALPGTTPVVVVTDATGPAEHVVRTTLDDLDDTTVGMRSVVLVGPSDPRRPA